MTDAAVRVAVTAISKRTQQRTQAQRAQWVHADADSVVDRYGRCVEGVLLQATAVIGSVDDRREPQTLRDDKAQLRGRNVRPFRGSKDAAIAAASWEVQQK
jgi:hypothetical protein